MQRSDEVLVVKNTPIIFACDGKARATQTASWYRQFGFEQVYVVDGGTKAWADRGQDLVTSEDVPEPYGLAAARAGSQMVSPEEFLHAAPAVVIFVDTSQDFARGHVPGSRWVPRGRLEMEIGGLAPSKDAALGVTCLNGEGAALTAATLKELGYGQVLAHSTASIGITTATRCIRSANTTKPSMLLPSQSTSASSPTRPCTTSPAVMRFRGELMTQ